MWERRRKLCPAEPTELCPTEQRERERERERWREPQCEIKPKKVGHKEEAMSRGTYRVMPRGTKCSHPSTWPERLVPTHKGTKAFGTNPCWTGGRADEHTRYDRRAAPPRPPRTAAPDRHTAASSLIRSHILSIRILRHPYMTELMSPRITPRILSPATAERLDKATHTRKLGRRRWDRRRKLCPAEPTELCPAEQRDRERDGESRQSPQTSYG